MPTQSVLPTCKTTGNEYEMPHKQGWQTEPSHTFKLKRGFILPFPNGISITQSSSRSDKFFLSFNLKSSTCCSAFSLYSREQDFTFWPSSWTNESEVMTLGSQDQLFCFSPGSAPEIVPQLLPPWLVILGYCFHSSLENWISLQCWCLYAELPSASLKNMGKIQNILV